MSWFTQQNEEIKRMERPEVERRKCETCEGTGEVWADDQSPFIGEMDMVECPDCNGTGHE